VDAICCTFDSVLATLEEISNGVDKCRAVESRGMSVSNDMARAADLVQGTIKILTDTRNDKAWDHLYKYTQDVARLNNIEISCSTTARPSRSKRLPQRLQMGIVMVSTG